MIRNGASLVKYYAAHPSVLLRHARRATAIAQQHGVRHLIQLVSTKIRGSASDRQRQEAERQARRRLSRLQEAQETHALSIVNRLIPFATDLSVIDIVADPYERVRLISCHILKKYSLLDEDYYRKTYLADLVSITPADHYMKYGLAGGLRPNAWFNPIEYVSAYPDVADAGLDPVIHYALFGWHEGRSSGSLFDGEYYLATNSDVAEANMSPLIHFLTKGRHERRLPRPRISACSTALPRSRGTIIIVSHDAELGGAQQVVRVFAEWLLGATCFDVKLVTMRGGPFSSSFAKIAPTFNIGDYPDGVIKERLKEFVGSDVEAVFINSVASGGFLKYYTDATPVVAFIHEMPKILHQHHDDLDLIKANARTIIGGSEAVRRALYDEFEIEQSRLATVHGFIEALPQEQMTDFDGKRTAKEALGLDPDAFLITGCGVLHWRKSPDKFIEVAERVDKDNEVPTQFVWIGGGPDQALCEKMVSEKGLSEKVRFTGYEPDIMRWLNASDLFLLPSEEDPFPLVCLYAAMALNPVVCFQEAGGIPEFVSQGCGRAVPFGDVDLMSEAVLDYLADDTKRLSDGAVGRALVEERYSIRATGPHLLHHIREAARIAPQLSVVVPSYNYERFLEERLLSITSQTFQDFEVILLDDKSQDGSVAVLTQWAEKRPGTQVIVNEENSGSPFAQWLRGMRYAKSELIWIAEADDSCRPELLETLLPYFDDRNVFLGYVKSIPIDEDGCEAGNYEDLYLNRISKGRWASPYVVSDHEEANLGLGIANCIPNASSVLFRRFDPEPEFEQAVTGMRMCGDWMFYLRAMRGGMVAYNNSPLNLHRRHSGTVTSKTEGSHRYFDEFAAVRAYLAETYRLDAPAMEKIKAFTLQDLDRFGISSADERNRIIRSLQTEADRKAIPSVLFVVSDLSPGGGQLFSVRMANAWMARGGRAVLLNVRQYPDHAKVLTKIDSRVALFHVDSQGMSLGDLTDQFDVDVIHSSLWWSDRYVDDYIDGLPDLPWVVTMHGCYESIIDEPAMDISFASRLPKMLRRVDEWVHTAEKNRRVFSIHGRPKAERRIDNGVAIEPFEPRSREDLGLRPNAIVLCLASRATADKGWFIAAELVEKLNEAGHAVDLMLIGEGPAAKELRVQAPPNVHFYGQVDDLQSYIEAADIGLLPTYFVGESMPLVILEMMACGKPTVSTDVGQIHELLQDGGGTVVPLKKGKADFDGLLAAVTALLDLERRQEMGRQARRRFESHYNLNRMIQDYDQLYRDIVAARPGQSKAV